MATFIETAVDITIELRRAGGQDKVYLWAQSRTSTGQQIRSVVEIDVTDIMPADLVAASTALLNAATTHVKNIWDIP